MNQHLFTKRILRRFAFRVHTLDARLSPRLQMLFYLLRCLVLMRDPFPYCVVCPWCGKGITKWKIGLERNRSLCETPDLPRNLLCIRTMAYTQTPY